VRPNQRQQQGGRIQKDAPIHVSNVMLLDPGTNKPTRVRFSTVGGEKHRTASKGGTDLGSTRKK
jgi:large subunit ribosomal protein L24